MHEMYVVQWKWGTSRGRDTYGYTTCSCWIDGKRLGSCSGGNYDLKGTAFAEAIMKNFYPEILKLAHLAHTIMKKQDGQWIFSTNPNKQSLYGLTAAYDEHNKLVNIRLDGACGLQSIIKVVEAAGFKTEYVNPDIYKLYR